MRKDIYDKLKILRKKHKYSQKELARVLNMSQNTYSLLECGKTKIDIERLIEIAGIYKIPVTYFLSEQDL